MWQRRSQSAPPQLQYSTFFRKILLLPHPLIYSQNTYSIHTFSLLACQSCQSRALIEPAPHRHTHSHSHRHTDTHTHCFTRRNPKHNDDTTRKSKTATLHEPTQEGRKEQVVPKVQKVGGAGDGVEEHRLETATNNNTGGQVGRKMDGRTDGRTMKGWMDGWMHGWTGGCIVGSCSLNDTVLLIDETVGSDISRVISRVDVC